MNRPPISSLFDPPFETLAPDAVASPVVFNSPHSGSTYPPSFIATSKLDAKTLRRSEDCYVDSLFEPVVELGAPLMRACFPRAYLDLNREPYELDPDMFSEPLPQAANTRSLRVAGGLGTIPRVVAEAAEIYAAPLPVAEAHARIEHLYKPYHAALTGLLDGMPPLFRRRSPGRLPLHAVGHARPAGQPARHGARRPVRNGLRAGCHRFRRGNAA